MSENNNYFDYSGNDINNKEYNPVNNDTDNNANMDVEQNGVSSVNFVMKESNDSGSAEANAVYSNGSYEEVPPRKAPKAKKTGGFFKKAMVSISLGLIFGLFAGVGFLAVQQLTDRLWPKEEILEEKEDVTDVLADGKLQEAIQEAISLSNSGNVTIVQTDVTNVAEKVMPAMVSIINKYTVTSSFFGQTFSEEEASSGSGIIVSETETELLIVSNNHVVADAETLEITFIDGSVAEAHIKGLDSDMDLAVIAVPLENISEETMDAITIAALGNSDDLKLGEPVVAIGNALGYGQSVTDGIVSALNRELTLDDGSVGTFIQTNAAINPGNSGGALLNMNGEVVGINSNKIGGTAIEGMGYAIPISSANPIIAELMERQTRSKVADDEVGYMGISPQEVTEQIAKMFNMPEGIYVSAVEEDSAAEKAGMMVGDIITKFDGETISSYAELQSVLQYYAAGDTADITVLRPENGQYVQYVLELTLGKRPAEQTKK